MPATPSPLWVTRIATALLAALATASLGYWILRWPAPSGSTRAMPFERTVRPIDSTQVAHLLGASSDSDGAGAAQPEVNLQSKYKLWGVIAQGRQSGSALIAMDGQVAKAYRVGDHISDELVLKAVQPRSVILAASLKNVPELTLELPILPGTRSTP